MVHSLVTILRVLVNEVVVDESCKIKIQKLMSAALQRYSHSLSQGHDRSSIASTASMIFIKYFMQSQMHDAISIQTQTFHFLAASQCAKLHCTYCHCISNGECGRLGLSFGTGSVYFVYTITLIMSHHPFHQKV